MNRAYFSSSSAEDTQRFARHVAGHCRRGDCLLLRGDLGAGKTTFSRAFIAALCDVPESEITSPTFALLQPYSLREGGTLAHFDLYRLRHIEETREIGLPEALQESLCLIEWPELAEPLWPEAALLVDIAYDTGYEESRILTLQAQDKRWLPLMEEINDAT